MNEIMELLYQLLKDGLLNLLNDYYDHENKISLYGNKYIRGRVFKLDVDKYNIIKIFDDMPYKESSGIHTYSGNSLTTFTFITCAEEFSKYNNEEFSTESFFQKSLTDKHIHMYPVLNAINHLPIEKFVISINHKRLTSDYKERIIHKLTEIIQQRKG